MNCLRYFDERAFRVLAVLGKNVSGSLDQIRTVMGASTGLHGQDPEAYVVEILDEYKSA